MLLSVFSCEDSSNNGEPRLDVGEDFISECAISSKGAVYSFSFDANGEWSVSTDEDWITVSPATGRGPATVKVTVAPYEDITAKYMRSACVDVSLGHLFERTYVSQLPMKPSLEFSAGTVLTPKISSKGGKYTFSFNTNKEWRALGYVSDEFPNPCDWITVSPTNGKGASTIEVTVSPNNTIGPRVHNIILEIVGSQSQASECTKAITITQYPEQPVPENVIYYTSSGDAVVKLTYAVDFTGSKPQDTFGAKELSNTYRNGLGTITFDGPVTRIPDDGLKYKAIKSIFIPNSVTSIGKNAFSNSGISSFVIPDSVTEIGDGAFVGTSLLDVSLPDHIKTIGNWFQNTHLRAFNFLDGATNIQKYAFSVCQTYYSAITIPEGITTIPEQLFYASHLVYIEFPKSLKEIKANAFANSGLKSVTIHDNITSIEKNAFDNCRDLKSVIFESMTPPTFGSDVFGNYSPKIYVPAGALNAYKSAPGLEKYQGDIIAFFGEIE